MICDYSDELTYTAGPPATSKQSIVGVAGTAIVGGRVKDGGAARDCAAGEPKAAYLRCVTAAVGATGGVQVDIVGADNALLTTNPVVLATKTIATAALTANSLHSLPLLAAGSQKRHLGVKITPLTTATTAGEVIVGLVPANARPQNSARAI